MDADDLKLLKDAAARGELADLRRKRISMTGRLSVKRNDMVTLIAACNGVYDEHPTWGTHYLIVGDTSIHGRTQKMREAEQRGARIIHENDFVKMILPALADS